MLIFFFLALQSAHAMGTGTYYSDLSELQKDVVCRYNGIRLNVVSKLEAIGDEAFSAPWMETDNKPDPANMFRSSTSSVVELVKSDIEDMLVALPKARFSQQQEVHMYSLVMKTKQDLLNMLNPFEEKWVALRRKPTVILQEDVDPFLKDCEIASEKVKGYFPSNAINVRKVLFPDYMGDKRPLDPKVSQLLATIEKEIDERKAINHDETVMVYGNVLAQKYFGQMCEVLPQLINLKKTPFGRKEIDKWLEEVNVDRKQMRGITDALGNFDPDVKVNGLKAADIWELTYSLVRQIYQERGDNEAKNLLGIYALKLDEQGHRCSVGSIGRHFEVLVKAFKLLIEQNSK